MSKLSSILDHHAGAPPVLSPGAVDFGAMGGQDRPHAATGVVRLCKLVGLEILIIGAAAALLMVGLLVCGG